MKLSLYLRCFGCILITWLIGPLNTMAQQYPPAANFTPLSFSENKGQWDKAILYKTDLGGSVITLKKNSFGFLLLNKQDLDQLSEDAHGNYRPGNNDNPHIEHGKVTTPTPASQTPVKENPVLSEQKNPAVRGHYYNVTFLNATDNPQVTADKAQEAYANYFIGNDPSKWASEVKSYQRVNYKNLYPGIDMQVYSEASQLKYDLIVNPGADPAQVKLQYDGATSMEIKKGQLYINTSVGYVIEQSPYAYQYINNQRVSVKVSYQLKNNQVSFRIGNNYDNKYALIIDPTYVFSTLTGAKADNWGFTATYDAQGNFYGGGIVRDANGYPTTPGAVQSVYAGGVDIGITKFSANGRNAIYSTYIGGNSAEQPHSLFVDPQGNLVIAGRTRSGNFPFKTSAGTSGGWDIAVVKLNATGTAITGAIRIGGSADDGVNIRDDREAGPFALLRNYGDDARSEVVLDGAGNIYVASCTRSANFPVTANAYQKTFGGSQDAVVMKIDPTCSSLLWATFLGGNLEDAAYVLAVNGTNSVYVAGGTGSSNFPTTAGSIYNGFRGGICDGFITHLSADGSSILQSTFLGSDNPAADQVYGIQLDAKGFVYVMGTTEGSWPSKQSPGTPTFYNDNSKQFIAKLQPDLSAFIYSTTFGKAASLPSLSPVAFLVDRCENVYVSGWGGGINPQLKYPNSNTFGLPLKDALQSTTDGADFYFFVLQRDATGILYGSYFGGNGLSEHVDGGTSRFDRDGVIYQGICAWCSAPGAPKFRYPVTPGTYATAPPTFCNLGALKIAFNLAGVKAGIKTTGNKNNFCVPATVSFEDTTSTTAQTWEWTVINQAAPVVMTTKDPFTYTFNAVGDYIVRLVKKDPSTCNGADTAFTEIKIREDKATLTFVNRRLEPCEALSYEFDNTGSIAPAGKPFTNKSFVLNFGDGSPADSVGIGVFPHKYQNPGVYNVTMTLVDTNYCNAPETITLQLRVAANVHASFIAPDSACAPATIEFNNTSQGGASFTWDFGDGNTSTDVNPTHTYSTPGTYNIHLVAVDNNTCNKQDDTTSTIIISPPPTADFDFTPKQPKENTPVSFTNLSNGAVSYVWNFGDGHESTQTNPTYQYNKTGTYEVCLTATNQFGCIDSVCKPVSAIVVPLYDVPSAFSPNGDGINDVFYVKGFAVSRFNIKIFNRWGQLVFESNDINIGWDGKFKGSLQSMDAYAYVINLEFNDGTKANKTGNLTLLR
ncbi:PKD domain-containing protein [Chitinophaga pendula]|uniref:DUF7948 domain-containing protein n=1 Tax=Chitinophaga pendula TaxID=2849666 RepID=UPI001CEDBDA6|nr:PKD domain-containing protein [Chitinophaga pendula]UCJ07684.1 PKD domain-containing protein [Chitinophaga pendula]